jgi:phage shock protein PspC (stress-responsive transcriptional regulator)
MDSEQVQQEAKLITTSNPRNLLYRINGIISGFARKAQFSYTWITVVYILCWLIYLASNCTWAAADQDNLEYTPILWFSYILNTIADQSLFLFEFYTAKEIDRRLKVNSFSFNIFAFIFVAVLALADFCIFKYFHPAFIIPNVLYVLGFYPMIFINVTMVAEMIKAFDRIGLKCAQDERISVVTQLPINPRPEAMRNTTKFYARISSLYKLLEFKLIMSLVFLVVITVLNLFLPGGDIAYYALIYAFRFLVALLQPLYFQYIVKGVEHANSVCFGCTWKVFGVDINTLIVVLPILSYVLALVKVLYS